MQGGKRTAAGVKVTETQFLEGEDYHKLGIINVKDTPYQAAGDGVTDDTEAIQRAFDSMVEGSMVVIPPGVYKITNLVFNPPNNCSMKCFGQFRSQATGKIITIGSSSVAREAYNIVGLDVSNSLGINWIAGNVGVLVQNLQSSNIDFRAVKGFETNILLEGNNGQTQAFNNFTYGLVLNGKVNQIGRAHV